jgi:hypothetical protein
LGIPFDVFFLLVGHSLDPGVVSCDFICIAGLLVVFEIFIGLLLCNGDPLVLLLKVFHHIGPLLRGFVFEHSSHSSDRLSLIRIVLFFFLFFGGLSLFLIDLFLKEFFLFQSKVFSSYVVGWLSLILLKSSPSKVLHPDGPSALISWH